MVSEREHGGRTYKLLKVETQEGLEYLCLRLYNAQKRFIKQFLFEPELSQWLIQSLTGAQSAA